MLPDYIATGLHVLIVVISTASLVLCLRIDLGIAGLRAEFLKLLAEHVRDYHPQQAMRERR